MLPLQNTVEAHLAVPTSLFSTLCMQSSVSPPRLCTLSLQSRLPLPNCNKVHVFSILFLCRHSLLPSVGYSLVLSHSSAVFSTAIFAWTRTLPPCLFPRCFRRQLTATILHLRRAAPKVQASREDLANGTSASCHIVYMLRIHSPFQCSRKRQERNLWAYFSASPPIAKLWFVGLCVRNRRLPIVWMF